MRILKEVFLARSLYILLAIGMIDLIATSVLHAKGLIVEMNPIMKPLIDRSEWLFAAVKFATLLGGWFLLMRYSKTHQEFVQRACLAGSGIYLLVWVVWFIHGPG